MATPITIKEACELLHMERPNVQKLVKRGTIESLGFQKTVGDSWRHLVSKESVEAYKDRKLNYSDDRAVFRMVLPLELYEKLVKQEALDTGDLLALHYAAEKAVNVTIRMAEYHAQRRRTNSETTVEEMTQEEFEALANDRGDTDDDEDEE